MTKLNREEMIEKLEEMGIEEGCYDEMSDGEIEEMMKEMMEEFNVLGFDEE